MTEGVTTRDDMELAGLVGRAINARDDPDALTGAVQAIVDWHENRWVRWLDVYEQHRAERRLALLAEADELERAIEARLECYICHRSKVEPGEIWCSWPHPRLAVVA